MSNYIKGLFQNEVLVAFSAIWGAAVMFLFPETAYFAAAGAVLGIMALDLATKLFALSRQAGGLKKAIQTHSISSGKFAKGTTDKLIVFGVMLIICGCAYRLAPIAQLATWFTQVVFTLMFLRDVLSIIENLTDAGVEGLAMFKKVVKKKLNEYVDEDEGSEKL